MGVSVRVPATTANLGPGFDTFGMALSLYNRIEVDFGTDGLQIEAAGDGFHLIPTDDSNTVYQAVREVFVQAGREQLLVDRGIRIRIENHVPVTRGLGSSATAIVGGLWAANELLGFPLGEPELVKLAIAMEGHPDNVTPAIFGGIVISGIVDEVIYTKRYAAPKNMKCVVAVPDFQLATRTSRRALPPAVPHADAVKNLNRVSLMVAALADGDLHMFCRMMEDSLHEPYRMPLVPGMKAAIHLAKQVGALSAVLSGSGPSIIAFCEGQTESVGAAMRSGFLSEGIAAKIYELNPVAQGVASLTSIS